MARVTVKELRAEARRRLLKCGNNKTISRMNKRELLEFLQCIHHPDADNLGGDDLGASVAGMFKEPKARRPKKRKGKIPQAYAPVSEEPDDLKDLNAEHLEAIRAKLKPLQVPKFERKLAALMGGPLPVGTTLIVTGTRIQAKGGPLPVPWDRNSKLCGSALGHPEKLKT